MARKSRTQPKQSPDTLNVLSKVYKTAIYVRLSAEKDETRDRKTLINQRNLIKNFVDQQMDMEIHDIYMDDEISGTTFDRPEFERMMSDMRAGRINCIVVKDLYAIHLSICKTAVPTAPAILLIIINLLSTSIPLPILQHLNHS